MNNDEYLKVSDNAMKVMYFEAMCMYLIEDDEEAKMRAGFKLSLGNLIYEMADRENNLALMLMVLDGANIIDDLDLVAKASTWLSNNKEIPGEHLKRMVNEAGYIAGNKEIAIEYALHAGMRIKEGFEEMKDISLMVNNEPEPTYYK